MQEQHIQIARLEQETKKAEHLEQLLISVRSLKHIMPISSDITTHENETACFCLVCLRSLLPQPESRIEDVSEIHAVYADVQRTYQKCICQLLCFLNPRQQKC